MAYFIRVVCIISLMIAASCALYALVIVYFIGSDLQYEGLKGEKNKGLKATLKFAKEHDMCMTEAQIQGANNI